MSHLYIRKFVDRLQHFENSGAKEFTWSVADAKRLHADITKLLLDLEESQSTATSQPEIIQIEVAGGSF